MFEKRRELEIELSVGWVSAVYGCVNSQLKQSVGGCLLTVAPGAKQEKAAYGMSVRHDR